MDARETIKRAYRALRVVGLGRSPTSAMSEEGRVALAALLAQWVGFGGSMPAITRRVTSSSQLTTDWPAMRLQCSTAGITITGPNGEGAHPIPDGSRLELLDISGSAASSPITFARNGALIDGVAANATLATNLGRKHYFFRADRCDWRTVSNVVSLDTEITDTDDGATVGILPFDFEEFLPRMLGKRLGSGLGQSLSRDDTELAEEGERRLRARYCKPPPMAYPAAVSNISSGMSGSVADSSYDGTGPF